MSHREQLRRHLEFFRELGVEGISRDARWRVCAIPRIASVILRIASVIPRIVSVIACAILRIPHAGGCRRRPVMTARRRP